MVEGSGAPIDRQEHIGQLLRQVRRLNRRLHGRVRPIGADVTIAQISVLHTLQELGPLRATDLARETGLSASSMTGQIDRLEAEGYVARQRSLEDRREVAVRLTPLAARVLEESQERMSVELGEVFSSLSDEEIETVSAIIAKLIG